MGKMVTLYITPVSASAYGKTKRMRLVQTECLEQKKVSEQKKEHCSNRAEKEQKKMSGTFFG